MMAAAYGYKKYRDNRYILDTNLCLGLTKIFAYSRYRNQEFLLTDSVFRYDGYSQLDDA